MREKGTSEYDPLRHQMVSLDTTYLLFGHGRHAWYVPDSRYIYLGVIRSWPISCSPGRFFAVNEVKAMMAHMVLNYDIKLPGDSRDPPKGPWFAGSRSPHPTAEVLFRKRKLN